MKTKNIFKLKYLFLLLTVAMLLMVTSSCDLLGGQKGSVVAPKIDSESLPRIERINPKYEEEEHSFYELDPPVTMPVRSNEKVHIILDYINKDNLVIDSVVINGAGREVEVNSTDFKEGSNSKRTIIEFEIDEVQMTQEITYTITKIFYRLGKQILQMTLDADVMKLKVAVDPIFSLTFDHQNADIRPGAEKDKTTKTIQVNYYQPLSDIIPSLSTLTTHENSPKKEGGWSFRGYYTETDGQGREVKTTDNFYFWKDVVLYAHYERLYDFTTSAAQTPIPYEEDGITKYYDEVATITRKTSAGDEQTTLEIFDTIADDKGIYPIVAIESAAFENTFNLNTLKIGKYVKYIGVAAFFNSRVTNVHFHSEGVVEKIDDQAFMGTSNLGTGIEGFTLPRTVTYLGNRCFEKSGWDRMIADGDATAKKTLIIYDNITHIGNWCFSETQFEEVRFMPGVKFKVDAVDGENYQIGEEEGQPIYADSDYYLGWCLFKNCDKIKRFRTYSDEDQANGLEIITDGMFDMLYYHSSNNVGLTSITLAEGLKKIGKGAFHYQKLLQSVTLPDTLEDICSDNEVNGSGGVFEGTRNEKSEYGAFAECHSLETVVFKTENSQLKKLGCKAFYNNRVLRSLDILSKVFEEYGDGPFQGCDSLTEVIFYFDDAQRIPQPMTYTRLIRKGSDLFYPTEKFKVFVEDEVVDGFRISLNEHASPIMKGNLPVYGQGMIKELWEGQTLIGKMALELTKSILDLNDGWLMGYFFGDRTDIILPDEYNDGTGAKRIVAIGSYAFNEVVQTIRLPQYVALIGNYAFNNCKNLSEITYGNILGGGQTGINYIKQVGEEAYYNTAITQFKGGENLEKIGKNAFWNCSNLIWVDLKGTKIKGGNNVLGEGAFYKCSSLQYVRLPAEFGSMEPSTFADCTSLRYIVFENPNPNDGLFKQEFVGTYFQKVPSAVEVYVPSNVAVDLYKGLANIPSVIKNRVQYNSEKPSPNPEDKLITQ